QTSQHFYVDYFVNVHKPRATIAKPPFGGSLGRGTGFPWQPGPDRQALARRQSRHGSPSGAVHVPKMWVITRDICCCDPSHRDKYAGLGTSILSNPWMLRWPEQTAARNDAQQCDNKCRR